MTPEEALIHAIKAEIARLPPRSRASFNPEEMAASYLAGTPSEEMEAIRGFNRIGHPDYQSERGKDEDEQSFAERQQQDLAMQEHLLAGYRGRGFTPEEKEALGREPESYEYSSGGRLLRDIEARKRLFDEIESRGKRQPKSTYAYGTSAPNLTDPLDAMASQYAGDIEQDKAYAFRPSSLNNPENFVGSYLTQMGPVLSDAGSMLATERNTGGSGANALGDAAARAYGADWNRTSPQLAHDRGWRENDALIKRMRKAYEDSNGQSSGDTFRSWTGGHIPYIQPLINGAMSFANGLLDFSSVATGPGASLTKAAASGLARSGVPVAKHYGSHIVRQISKDIAQNPGWAGRGLREIGDETLDVGNVVNTVGEFAADPSKETPEQFQSRTAKDAEKRKLAIRDMEANQDQIVRPVSPVKRVTEPVGKAIGAGGYNASKYLYDSLLGK
jgi:hypothetical protein